MYSAVIQVYHFIMKKQSWHWFTPAIFCFVAGLTVTSNVAAQTVNAHALARFFGRRGKTIGHVVKFSFPRTDLRVSIQGVLLRPALALGSRAAFLPAGHSVMMMGDLVLRPREVNPVLKRLRARGIEITAIHNHLLFEHPRLIYMHYMGKGSAIHLARDLRYALSASKTPSGKPKRSGEKSIAPAFARKVESRLGRKGTISGKVLMISVPRAQSVRMHGIELPSAMGVAESINIQQTAGGRLATTGDFVILSKEVQPVIDALIAHGFTITALHTHMLTEQPRLFFLHFWDAAPRPAVLAGIRAALAHIAVRQ